MIVPFELSPSFQLSAISYCLSAPALVFVPEAGIAGTP
jgi:hypothetical protein